MFDFNIGLSPMSWGVIESATKNSFTIKKEEYAPGIWAGTKNTYIKVISPEGKIRGIYLVISTELNNRSIEINNLAGLIQPGDLIYHKDYK